MQELFGGAGALRDDGVLLNEVDRQVQIVDCDLVADVAVQPVGLFNEDRAA